MLETEQSVVGWPYATAQCSSHKGSPTVPSALSKLRLVMLLSEMLEGGEHRCPCGQPTPRASCTNPPPPLIGRVRCILTRDIILYVMSF